MTSYGPLYTPTPVRWRSLNKIVLPSKYPVTLLEVKQQLRLESCFTEDDAYIERLIAVATEYAETYCDMTFILSKWRMTIDRFPAVMQLPKPPAHTAPNPPDVFIQYIGTDPCSDPVTLLPDQYRVDFETVPAHVYVKCDGQGWPSTSFGPGNVRVEWWAGYGPDYTFVPHKIRHAILMLVAQHYERRLAAECVSSETLFGVKTLLDASKWGAYS